MVVLLTTEAPPQLIKVHFDSLMSSLFAYSCRMHFNVRLCLAIIKITIERRNHLSSSVAF